jgi:hypothetical protein
MDIIRKPVAGIAATFIAVLISVTEFTAVRQLVGHIKEVLDKTHSLRCGCTACNGRL